MERSITLFITSLFTAPLILYSVLWVFTRNSVNSNTDQTLGKALLTALAGIVVATIWVIMLYRMSDRFLYQPYLRYLQIADVALFIGWLIILWMYLNNQPYKFAYTDSKPVLDIEVKAHPSILLGKPIEDAIHVQFVGGEDFNLAHPEKIREENNHIILPWETTIFSVVNWHIRIFLYEQPVTFMLKLPKKPKESIDWSEWIPPSHYEDDIIPEELMLRYRFRVVPHGSQ